MKEAPPRPQRAKRGDSIEPPRAPRRLSDEEIALWTEVARSVARRRGAKLPPSNPAQGPRAPSAALMPADPPKGRPPKRPAAPLVPIERRIKRELRQGRAGIDAALDLHGLTQAEAHRALRGFLLRSQARGARLILVVTGKGAASDEPGRALGERGVLRRLAPHWLREGDLRSVVLGFEEAGRAHGGEGALYVRLRRLDRASERR